MFRLAHCSDPHLHVDVPTPSLSDRFSKRALSRLSWARGRSALQRPEVLAAAVDDIRAHAPDHWLVSGDITNFSLPSEFVAAARWLEALGPANAVTVVPGNHDALVPMPAADGWDHWQPWLRGDDGATGFPFVRIRGDVALIGLSSAIPTPPGFASGELGAEQLLALEARLVDLGQRGFARIVTLHHPPAEGVVTARKALVDRSAFRAVLARTGAELVLHGHSRDARFDPLRGPQGLIPVLGVPSISAIPNPKDEGARWNLIEIERTVRGWHLAVHARRWQPQDQRFAAAGSYRLLLPASGAANGVTG